MVLNDLDIYERSIGSCYYDVEVDVTFHLAAKWTTRSRTRCRADPAQPQAPSFVIWWPELIVTLCYLVLNTRRLKICI